MEKILVIDDNKSLRYTLTILLEEGGYKPTAVADGYKALQEVKTNKYALAILDMKMPGMDGMEVLREIKKITPELPIIMLTAFGDIKSAVETMKHGAYDYVTKPFDNDEMLMHVKKALDNKYLTEEVNILRKKIEEKYIGEDVIGSSLVMQAVFNQVKIVAPTDITVLIQGESGTGKEVIANLIHKQSPRKNNKMISVDCGAIPETLIESELFGHEKGAFTDAKEAKEGKFEQANGGTILLDEITNLTDANQIKLLRVLQERKVTRLGGKKSIDLDVRIITASNVKLSDAVKEKKFRLDLYYRLNEFHIDLPPLRERKDDIPLFIEYFIKSANKELNKNVLTVPEKIMKDMLNYNWSGNVRELRNVIRRAVLLSNGTELEAVQMTNEFDGLHDNNNNKISSNGNSIEDSKKQLEKEIIVNALKETGGNKSKAAKVLNINERTFYRKLKSLGLSE